MSVACDIQCPEDVQVSIADEGIQYIGSNTLFFGNIGFLGITRIFPKGTDISQHTCCMRFMNEITNETLIFPEWNSCLSNLNVADCIISRRPHQRISSIRYYKV